jgi:NADH-quinone oxidoreductase subunit N
MLDRFSLIVTTPEILLLTMACVIAIVDLGVTTRLRDRTFRLTLFTLALVAFFFADLALGGDTWYAFGRMVVSDPMGNWLKCFATISMMVCLVYARPYAADRDMLRGGELFTLAMFALLGICVMISGTNFLVLYLGLELLTLSSYALVALRRDNTTATEAAMKYFVLVAPYSIDRP